MALTLIPAGNSDKYGQIFVERSRTGWDDAGEPVALFRARDMLSLPLLKTYYEACIDANCSIDQLDSVSRQVDRFIEWRTRNEEKLRLPGS